MKATKTDQAKTFLAAGDVKNCLKIVKTFALLFTKDELCILQVAYECLSGNEAFYIKMGHNVEVTKAEAVSILQRVLGEKK